LLKLMQYEIANVYFQAFDGTHCEYAQTDGQGKSTSGPMSIR